VGLSGINTCENNREEEEGIDCLCYERLIMDVMEGRMEAKIQRSVKIGMLNEM